MIDSKGLSEQMYKVFSSFWSTTKVPTPLALDDVDDGDWVMINRSKDENDRTRPTIENENPLENSWISSPPLIKSDEAIPLARLNPIENLLIEHASMSVYEDIASKSRRQDSPIRDIKVDEQTEDEEEEDLLIQNPNMNSIHHRLLSDSSAFDLSTSSLLAHQRHLTRLHQRRKRPTKSPLGQTPRLNNKLLSPSSLRSS